MQICQIFRRALFLVLACCFPLLAGANSVRDIRFGMHEGFVRCVIESEHAVEFRIRNASQTEKQISFQLLNIRSGGQPQLLSGQMGQLASARTEYDAIQQSLFLHLGTSSSVRVETTRLQNPNRLVIDFHDGSGGTVAASPTAAPAAPVETVAISRTPVRPTDVPSTFKRKIVVIDAGHGGHHRGGHGFVKGRKVEEAELTLPIAVELEKMLNADSRFDPRMTRRNDKYIGLRERTRMAEQFNGDVFVSIHFNAVPANASKTKARGLEIYTWSPNDSRNTADKYLQDLENEEGSASDLSGANRDAKMVLSKLMLDTLEEQALKSKVFARELEQEFLKNSYFKAHYRGLKSARFKVLENYNMPSVLIEVAFISHPDEAARATTKDFQRDVARHIYDGLVDYFENIDPAMPSSRTQVARR